MGNKRFNLYIIPANDGFKLIGLVLNSYICFKWFGSDYYHLKKQVESEFFDTGANIQSSKSFLDLPKVEQQSKLKERLKKYCQKVFFLSLSLSCIVIFSPKCQCTMASHSAFCRHINEYLTSQSLKFVRLGYAWEKTLSMWTLFGGAWLLFSQSWYYWDFVWTFSRLRSNLFWVSIWLIMMEIFSQVLILFHLAFYLVVFVCN